MRISFFDGEDVQGLAEAFLELYQHYFGAEAPTMAAVRRNIVEIAGGTSGVKVAVAREQHRIVGFATAALLYPAPQAQGQLFMKDLYVRDGWRGRGVGRQILGFLARHAVARHCVRLDWTAERDNLRALDFYTRFGADRVEEKVYFRLTGASLHAAATTYAPAAEGGQE